MLQLNTHAPCSFEWSHWHWKLVHGCLVYTETFAETAAILRGTSHVTAKQHCNHRQIFKNALCKATLFRVAYTLSSKHTGSDPEAFWFRLVMASTASRDSRIWFGSVLPKTAWIILCKISPDRVWFWMALSGCGRNDPFRKKADVQESSGPDRYRAGSVSGSDANRIRHVYWAEGRGTTVAIVKRLGLISRWGAQQVFI